MSDAKESAEVEIEALEDILAADLYEAFRHYDPVGDPPWELAEDDIKRLYRLCIGKVLQVRRIVVRECLAHYNAIDG